MRRQSWRICALAALLLFGSFPFFVFAIWFGVIALVGIVMLVAGVALLASGLRHIVFPYSHPALWPLGRSNEQRAQVLRELEMELEWPDSWRTRTGRGSEIILSRQWLVHFDDSDFGVVRRDDVVWIYEYKKSNFSGSTPAVLLCTRYPIPPSAIEIGPLDGWLLPTLAQAMPFAFVGLHLQLGHVPRAVLGQHVDARRYAAMTEPRPGS